jgi:hypothetical protein
MSFIESYASGLQGQAGQFQRDALARATGEVLFPNLLFRAGVVRGKFEGTIGDSKIIAVPGLITPNTTPRQVGVTPQPKRQTFEYYRVSPQPYGDVISQSLPGNYASAVGPYWQAKKGLVLQAAMSLNRLLRNKLFAPYIGGHGFVDVSAAAGATLTVSSLNGFSTTIDATSAYPVAVSSTNTRAVKRNGVLIAETIIGATPTDPLNPLGPGVLTMSAATAFVAGDRIDAVDASPIVRPNGAASVDAISIADTFSLGLVHDAVTQLRNNSVPPHADGFYHVHFPAAGERALLGENSVQRQIETRGLEDQPFKQFAFGAGGGALFFSNTECPDLATVDSTLLVQSRPVTAASAYIAGDIGGELVNKTGVNILRAVVTGGNCIFESYVDEMSYMTEAGYLGRVEARSVENRGIEVRADGIRFVDQAPTDIFGEGVQMGWSYTGDFTCPTNRLSGKGSATYKCAVAIEAALPSAA